MKISELHSCKLKIQRNKRIVAVIVAANALTEIVDIN